MQTEGRTRTDRLILMLGIIVALLAVLIGAVVMQGTSVWFGKAEPDLADRAQRQLRQYVGRNIEVRYTEAGRGLALCGYAGRRGEARAFSFISRPNRIITSDDPLPTEFNEMMTSFCPGFARRPGVLASPSLAVGQTAPTINPAPRAAP